GAACGTDQLTSTTGPETADAGTGTGAFDALPPASSLTPRADPCRAGMRRTIVGSKPIDASTLTVRSAPTSRTLARRRRAQNPARRNAFQKIQSPPDCDGRQAPLR